MSRNAGNGGNGNFDDISPKVEIQLNELKRREQSGEFDEFVATLLVPLSRVFACIWHFDKILPNLSHSPKSSNPPTRQASMRLAYLHLFGNLGKSCQIRHRHDCGKISSKLPNSPLPAFRHTV